MTSISAAGLSPRLRFSANLRKARLAARITQQELADRCYLHRTEVSLLERGLREPRLGTLVKLAGALGVSAASLAAGMAWNVESQRFEFKR